MTARTWVGANGGVFTTSTNWSPSGTPTSADDLTFSTNSLGATISATATCKSITVSGTGVTISGTAQLTVANNITLNAATTWSHTGILVLSGASTLTTNGVTIASAVSMTATAAQPTLAGNFNGTGTFTCSGGTLTLGTYQWTCSTFTSTGSTATALSASTGGGITVTGTSGTVVNVTKTAAQLTFPSAKPTFILSATGSGRGITWTGTTWTTNASTMPGLKITSGGDTVTITHTASQAYYNLAFLNTTGFTGTLTYATAPITATNIYGDFVFPAGNFTNYFNVYCYGTNNIFAAVTNVSCLFGTTSAYTQSGDISVNYAGVIGGTYTTGSFTLNNTGTLSGNFSIYGVTLVGAIVVNTPAGGTIYFYNANTSSLTSITQNGSSGSQFYLQIGTYNAPITFNGSIYPVFAGVTLNGNVTFNVAQQALGLNTVTFANPLTVTTKYFSTNNTVNIPNTSVITVGGSSGGFYGAASVTYTNTFRINLITASTTAITSAAYSDQSGGNDPDFYISGSGDLIFNDNNTAYQLHCNSLDVTAFGGTYSSTDVLYINSSFTQISGNPLLTSGIYTYGAAATFTLSATNISSFTAGGSAKTVQLNNASITLIDFSINTPAILDAGTSTITVSRSIAAASQRLYNVVVAGNPINITASYINSITNTIQPTTVRFFSNVTFGTFGLNGTAGNLVTATGLGTQRTLSKSTPWNLDNSTDGGNNSGLNFLSSGTGNNSYLSVSYINGVFALPLTSASASGAAGSATYAQNVSISTTGVQASGIASTPNYVYSTLLGNNTASGFVGNETYASDVQVNATGVAASGFASTPAYALSTGVTGDSASGAIGNETYTNINTVVLTSGTSWTVPSDWNSASNNIYLIGGGGGGGGTNGSSTYYGGGGGGGGGFTKLTNLTLTPGTNITYAIGPAGTAGQINLNGGAGGTTSFYSGFYTAGGGSGGVSSATSPVGGTGGTGTTYNGGTGGAGASGTGTASGGGGGGAAGPNGAGGAGGNGSGNSTQTNAGGGGGGGNGGGSAGQNATTTYGGAGGNNSTGSGGGAQQTTTNPGNAGSNGGGGSGGYASTTAGENGGAGGNGIDITGSVGSGGGSGGSKDADQTATAGNYGGGGGGGGRKSTGAHIGGAGAQGVIVITYTPTNTTGGPVTSVNASGNVGTVQYSSNIAINTVYTSGLLGTAAYSKDISIGVTAVSAAGLVSTPTYSLSKAVTSDSASGVIQTLVYGITPALTSVVGSGVASGFASYAVQYALTGTYANGYIGQVVSVYWKLIDTAQNADWASISNTQTPAWTVIDTAQVPGWTGINT